MLAMLGGYATQIFFGHGIKIGLAAGALIALLSWDYSRIKSAERRGGQQVITKVNKANARSTKIGAASARASGKPSARGVRDPGYRD